MAAEALGRLFGESSIGAVWVEGGEPEDGPEPSAQVAVAVVDEEDWPFALPGQDEGGWEADDGDERPVAPALADEDDLLEGEDLYWEGLDYEEVVAQGDSMDIAIAAAGEAAPRVAEPSAAKATHWVWQTEDEDDFEPCDSCEELWGLAKYLRSEAHRLDDEAGDESEQEGEEEWEEEGEEYTEEGALARAEAAPPSGGADELTVTLEADEDEDVVIALENDSGDDIEVEVTDDSVHEHVVATLPHGSWALIHSTADSDHHLSMDVMPSVGRNQIEQRPENKDRDEWEDLDEIVIEEYVDTEVDTSDADIVINLDTLLGDEKPSALDSQYNGHVFKVEVDVQKITEPQPYAGADPYKLIDYLQEYVHRLENVLMLVYAFICVALVAILFYIYQLYAAVFPAARDDDVYDEESIDGSAQDMTLFEAAKNQINVVLATDYIQSESSPDAGYYVPLADTDKSKQ
uniref:Uncharacterized protein n=1 Tax=Tetraselmis sp. GSL018 TaxID=582737 RepID=A0A061RL09_9CHLO